MPSPRCFEATAGLSMNSRATVTVRGAAPLGVAASSTKLTYVPGAPRIVEIARRRSKK
jgi:hypothetical protein